MSRLTHPFPAITSSQLTSIGTRVLRYGLVALLVLWGGMKFTAFEAEAIRGLVGNHPLMSWMYPAFGVRGASAIIGVVELLAALLIITRRWRPLWSAYGSLIASTIFVVTLSFLFTTPNVLSPDNPNGGFLMKDLILLGAALFTSGEAFAAAAKSRNAAGDEALVHDLISRWASAVRAEDRAGIRASHDLDILMFDVPPPFLSRGIEAYMATWDTFFPLQSKPVQFDFRNVEVVAGIDVAFATAIGRCGDLSSGTKVDLEFRLTMGFRKVHGQWRIVHEHHSIPATA